MIISQTEEEYLARENARMLSRSITNQVIEAAGRLSESDIDALCRDHEAVHREASPPTLTMREFIEICQSRYESHNRAQISIAYLNYTFKMRDATTFMKSGLNE